MADEWELRGFGECVVAWLEDEPPIEWRRAVNEWFVRLQRDPVDGAVREPALDDGEWSGWYCEIPGAGDRMQVTACFFRVSKRLPLVHCLTLATAPKHNE